MVDMQEFVSWSYVTLAVPEVISTKVYLDLDMCSRGFLQELQLAFLPRSPDVVVIRVVLASRYGRDWRVMAAADANEDGGVDRTEWLDFSARLMFPGRDALPLFLHLDFDGDGAVSFQEIRVVATADLLLFDFRRLTSLAFAEVNRTFGLADADANGGVSLSELEIFACDHLAVKTGGLQGSDSVTALFNAFDEFGVGELPRESFNVFGGEVAFSGYKRLVQSMFPSSWDAFLIYDTNFDRRLQREELRGARGRSKGACWGGTGGGRGKNAERDA